MRAPEPRPRRIVGYSNLGCTKAFFVAYIEAMWKPGMAWENYGCGRGRWQIDHIIPKKAFDFRRDGDWEQCCRHTNLQPLWWHENAAWGGEFKYSPVSSPMERTQTSP